MEAEEKSDGDERDGKHMRDDVMKGINEEDGNHEADHQRVFIKENIRDPIFEKEPDQEQRRNDLHKQVMPVDDGTAFFASAPQDYVADNG